MAVDPKSAHPVTLDSNAAWLSEAWRDERGKEMADGARVWDAYVQEANEYDKEEHAGWGQSMDVLFIFAALFSAVLTAFIIESYKQLSPDPQDASLAAFQEATVLLRSIATQSSPPDSPNPMTPFQPTSSAIWVNALWLGSLAISLSVSSIAVLVKQWLNALHADFSGDAHARARLRQYRYEGLLVWRLPVIINILPTILILSLILFLSGLIIFMWSINFPIAVLLLGLIGITSGCHLSTLILPLVYPNCPFRTPLNAPLHRATYPLRMIPIRRAWDALVGGYFACKRRVTPWVSPWIWAVALLGKVLFGLVALPVFILVKLAIVIKRRLADAAWHSLQRFLAKKYGVELVIPAYLLALTKISRTNNGSSHTNGWLRANSLNVWRETLSQATAEYATVMQCSHSLDGSALLWLAQSAKTRDTRELSLEAVAGLGRNLGAASILWKSDVAKTIRERFESCFRGRNLTSPAKAELFARALMNMHCCARIIRDGVSMPSRSRDTQIVQRLATIDDRELAVSGACTGAMIEEVVHFLRKHVEGQSLLSPFSVQLLVDTIRDEFSCRKGWDDHYWVTDRSWGKWGRLTVPLLVSLLDLRESAWPELTNPDPVLISTILAISVFTCGDTATTFKSLTSEAEQRRRVVPLGLRSLAPILQYPDRYVSATDIDVVERAFVGFTERLELAHSLYPELADEIQTDPTVVILKRAMDRPYDPQIEKTLPTAVKFIRKGGFNRHLYTIAWLFDNPASSSIRRTLLYFLEDHACDSADAMSLLLSEVPRALVRVLSPEDPNRRDAFRVLVLAFRTTLAVQTVRGRLLDELGFLRIVVDYFHCPWGIRQEEVSWCLNILDGILVHESGTYDEQVGTAVQSIAQWPERQWQGEERLFPHRAQLARLVRKLALEPPVARSVDWFNVPLHNLDRLAAR